MHCPGSKVRNGSENIYCRAIRAFAGEKTFLVATKNMIGKDCKDLLIFDFLKLDDKFSFVVKVDHP